MIRIALAALTVVVFDTGAALAQPATPPDTLEQSIQDWFAPLVDSRDFSGVVMIQRGAAEPVALTFGYADWVTGDPMRNDIRFPVGSITKSLTAAMIRRLVEEDRLSLDTPVSRLIPELSAYGSVRIGDIVDHTAGLARDVPPGVLADARSDTLVAWLAEQGAPDSGPHDYAYSNVGYGLLAIVCERVMNARFETLMATEFLVPLEMDASRIVRTDAARRPGMATGFAAGPLPLDLRAPMADIPSLGASGLVAPMRDLLRLGEAVRTRRIDLFEPDGRMVGSWNARVSGGEAIYTIQGSVPGYSGGISVLPGRDLIIAYGTNIESYSNWGIRDVLHALAMGQPVAPPNLRTATHPLEEGHLDAAGLYEGGPYGPMAIQRTDGGLDLVLTDRDWHFYLTPTGNDALNWRLFNVDLAFERDEAGRVAAISAREHGLAGEARSWRLNRTDLPSLPPTHTTADDN